MAEEKEEEAFSTVATVASVAVDDELEDEGGKGRGVRSWTGVCAPTQEEDDEEKEEQEQGSVEEQGE